MPDNKAQLANTPHPPLPTPTLTLCQMPDDEAQLEEEELEALQEDMHADYELAQIIK